MLKKYGFEVSRAMVIDAVRSPLRVDRRGRQFLVLGAINNKHALRVVYEKRKGIIVVITFYPVRRERHGI